MIGKVAEMLALRRAFPAELSGLYSAEEMEQAAVVSPPPRPQPGPPPRRQPRAQPANTRAPLLRLGPLGAAPRSPARPSIAPPTRSQEYDKSTSLEAYKALVNAGLNFIDTVRGGRLWGFGTSRRRRRGRSEGATKRGGRGDERPGPPWRGWSSAAG
jgi:hypothetical protein